MRIESSDFRVRKHAAPVYFPFEFLCWSRRAGERAREEIECVRIDKEIAGLVIQGPKLAQSGKRKYRVSNNCILGESWVPDRIKFHRDT